MKLVVELAEDEYLIKSIAKNDLETIKRHIAMYEANVKELTKPAYIDHAKHMLRLSKLALKTKAAE